jgi:hypothetical protein
MKTPKKETVMNSLRLYEEILLLELDDEKGTTPLDSSLALGMGGAMLAELVMTGHLAIDQDKKKHVHRVVGARRLSDPILAEALALVKAAKKPKKAQDWVQKFSGMKDLKNRVARGLVKKGVLKEGTDKVLLVFSRTIFPESNPGPERELRQRLEQAIFTDTRDVAPETIVILSLAKATGLIKKLFDKKELKARKQRIEDLASGQVVGKATKEAIEAVQAVLMVAAIMPAITVTTITSSS